jgi:hypothetical protein
MKRALVWAYAGFFVAAAFGVSIGTGLLVTGVTAIIGALNG